MATYKALPYGISDFGQIRNESLYLVDKSMYIETTNRRKRGRPSEQVQPIFRCDA